MVDHRDHVPVKDDPAVTSGRGERSVKVEKSGESKQPAKPAPKPDDTKHEDKAGHSCCS